MVALLWWLLIPYALFGLLFAILALVDVYHMVRFGTFGLVNFVALFLFLAGTAIILWWTAGALVSVDWQQPIATIGGWSNAVPSV